MVVGRVEPVCSADDVKSRNPTPPPAACSPPDNLHPQTARTLGVRIWAGTSTSQHRQRNSGKRDRRGGLLQDGWVRPPAECRRNMRSRSVQRARRTESACSMSYPKNDDTYNE